MNNFFDNMAKLLNKAVEKFSNTKILKSHRQTFNMSDGTKIRVTITKLKDTLQKGGGNEIHRIKKDKS